ncbi:macrophage mannose receptor 1-like [Scomber scombrus]|uniref:Macrophage mannose receptor 1-like n=1 Tax=Scomber scombrus TaxID=13677 RepID=A0AAV1NP08_SCOSC
MSWTEAQAYCRKRFTDLATIDNPTDNERLLKLAKQKNIKGNIWIGFYDDLKRWKWSMDDEEFYLNSSADFMPWLANQPNNKNGNQFCAMFRIHFELNDLPCHNTMHFICSDATSTQSYVLVEKELTWPNAQAYCRKHHKDLATIRNKEEYDKIKLALKKPAWIGLYREWAWSDKTQVTFVNWKTGEPNHGTSSENCGAFSPTSGKWLDKPCEEKGTVFCTKVTPKQTTLKIKIRSTADMNSKDVQQQISNQLQANMESARLTVFKIKWRNVQRYCENQEKKPDREVICTDAV